MGAAQAGRVVFSGVQSGYGNIVVVRHGDGSETAYAHLSAFDVRVGDTVAQGQQLGRVGNTGRSFGPHLHFEVRVGGQAQDPLRHLPR